MVNDQRDPSPHVPGCSTPGEETRSAARYPEELVGDFVTPSGGSLHVRPIRSDDAVRLVDFHSRLSPDAIYRRYFSLHPRLSHGEVRHLTEVDYVDRLALVVMDDTDIVAIGRYDRVPSSTTAEVAFVVRDDFQRIGLGGYLLDTLARAAWERGVTQFDAVTYLYNRGMIAVFTHSGFPVTSSPDGEELTVSFPIDPKRRRRTTPLRDPRGTA